MHPAVCAGPVCIDICAENACDVFPELHGVTPRPEPPRSDKRDHDKWLNEYKSWRNVKCPCGTGYFCKRHGEWIPGSAVTEGHALPAEEQDEGDCPDDHYELSSERSQRSITPPNASSGRRVSSAPQVLLTGRASSSAPASVSGSSDSGYASHRSYKEPRNSRRHSRDYVFSSGSGRHGKGKSREQPEDPEADEVASYYRSSENPRDSYEWNPETEEREWYDRTEDDTVEEIAHYSSRIYQQNYRDRKGSALGEDDGSSAPVDNESQIDIMEPITEGLEDLDVTSRERSEDVYHDDDRGWSEWSDWIWDENRSFYYAYRYDDEGVYEYAYEEPAKGASRRESQTDRTREKKSKSSGHRSSKHKSRSKH